MAPLLLLLLLSLLLLMMMCSELAALLTCSLSCLSLTSNKNFRLIVFYSPWSENYFQGQGWNFPVATVALMLIKRHKK